MDFKNEEQKEFFQEFKTPKNSLEKIRDKYISNKPFYFAFPVETLAFTGIAVIIIVIIFFSLGVERGRYLARSSVAVESPFKEEPLSKVQAQETAEKPEPKQNIEVKEKKSPAEVKVSEKADTPKKVTAKYSVQVATYKDKNTANKDLDSLKKQGYYAFILPKDNFYQICVGTYGTAAEAKAGCEKMRSRYKDCFVKKID